MLAPMCMLVAAFVIALLFASAVPAYAANSSKSASKVPEGTLTVTADAYAVESPAKHADPEPDSAPPPEPEAPASAAQPSQTASEAPAAPAQHEQPAPAEPKPSAPAEPASAAPEPESAARHSADEPQNVSTEQSSSPSTKAAESTTTEAKQLADAQASDTPSSSQANETQPVATADASQNAPSNENKSETKQVKSENVSSIATASTTTNATTERTENASPQLKTQSNDGKGSISVIEPHAADITYSASEGGAVILGADETQSGSSKSVTEHHDNSLTGKSVGATAIPEDGFHFVRWIDALTGATLSSSPTFVPDQPDGGWPVSTNITAVFARDMYVLILDPNGGTAGGGGGSSGVITLEITPGTDFKIPVNGSDAVSMTKAGSAFVGWKAVADPSKTGTTTDSYAIADGQILDAATESSLSRLGFLDLDWSNENTPTLTLQAQWLVGQVAIKYKADDGGLLASNSNPSGIASTIVSEIMDANTGVHAYDSTNVGPNGVTAVADARNHFAGWTVSGSSNVFKSDEAKSADLSSEVVTRMTYYPNNTNMPSKYHAATFTASFAPNTYVFAYEANGGTGSIGSASVTYGSTLTAASSGLTRKGYNLKGWNLSADGSGTAVALGAKLDAASIDSMIASGAISDEDAATATLYAQWEYAGGDDPEPEPDPNPKPSPKPSYIPTPVVVTDIEPATVPTNKTTKNTENTETTSEKKTKTDTKTEKKSDTKTDTKSESKTETKNETKSDSGSEPVNPVTEDATTPTNSQTTAASQPMAEPETPAVGLGAEATAATTTAATTADKTPVEKEKAGLLATDKGKGANDAKPVVVRESYNDFSGSSNSGEESSNVLNQLMTPEGMQTATTTVAAVAAVGAIAGLVGVGVSVAGAAMIGAATIGTASAIGLTTAADLAADLAASAALGGAAAGFGGKRRRKEEEEGEDGLESQEQTS